MSKTVQDLMTSKVISVTPETPLVEAATILNKRAFNALPVVSTDGSLLGMFSERDLITSGSYIHLKTLINLLNQIDFYKKDSTLIKDDLKKVLNLKVSDVMSNPPVTLTQESSIEQATQLFADPKNNPIPIVDKENKLIGIIAMSDLAKLYGVSLRRTIDNKTLDENVDKFILKFEKQFVLVSKTRTKLWLVVSLSFALIGFIIAFLIILRISV